MLVKCSVTDKIQTVKNKLGRLINPKQNQHQISLLNIPPSAYNYTEYRDGLVSDDFL